jgi:hypothetical protein
MVKLLILYVFHIYNKRVNYFINNCIFYNPDIDFVVVSNGVKNVKIPDYATFFYRENIGFDFGGWSDALLTNDLYKKYDYFLFVNSSVMGPFLPKEKRNTWPLYYLNGLKYNNVKLFEIGICDKRFPFASVKLWLTYFKNLELYSVDNFWGSYLDEKTAEINMLNNMGCNFIYADQGNFNDWSELKQQCPNDFDFFIEDGSHWPNHMAVSLWQARNMIKPGGYYFMEDLQNPLTSRGKFRYDNTLLTENLLESQETKVIRSHFLNDQQNNDVNESFELVDMILDQYKINYLAVLKKK